MRNLTVVFFLLCMVTSPAIADETPKARAMLVLDASGSMWGKIEGKNKIVVAREVIADLMKDWDDSVHLGLSAYGHRTSQCNDIETLVKVGPNTSGKITEIVNGLQPIGSTPLSAAVKKAAEELGYTKGDATVILVSDGAETCKLDPCAVGKSLEENGINFTAHVIGFAVKKEDQIGLKCLAENTGGKFLSADNAGELKEALGEISAEVRTRPDSVYVIIDKSHERYRKDVTWYVFNVDEEGNAVGNQIYATVGNRLSLRQPPGNYLIRAEVGQVLKGEKLVEIKEDETREHDIDMRAGTYHLSGVMKEGGNTISRGDISWYIYPYQNDGTVSRSSVYSNVGRKLTVTLPPGKYLMKGQYGDAIVRIDLLPQPGETKNLIANFNAGVVGLSGNLAGQKINRDIGWYVYKIGTDGKPQRGQIASNIGKKIWMTLNAGNYRIKAEYDGLNTFTDIEVKAGEKIEKVLIFKKDK